MVTFKEFFSFKNNRFFWLNLVAMIVIVIAVALGTLQWLDSYTRHGEAVVVPNVKGMNLRLAENELDKQSLKSIVIDSSYVKGIPPGAILGQNPAGGSKVKEGRTVYLTINADSAPQVAVPDIMDNSSLRQAEAKLRALGFKVTDPEYISGDKDWVYSIKYRGRTLQAGEKVPHEAVLTLCVGNGNDTMPEDSTMTEEVSGTTGDDTPVVDESWF
ncbi:MAG: PASTA domain-containing protein [Bacteroides sp.]|nr:PASTA domain-containing protein [Bacteroides sp.]